MKMKEILIIYGTTGGNTELVVDQVASILGENGFCTRLMRADRVSIEEIMEAVKVSQIIVLASPTYGHGQLQEHMVPVVDALKGTALTGKKYAVIGLGDPKYDDHYHIESTFILESVMETTGATRMHYALRISRSPLLQVDNLIPKWTEKFMEALRVVC